MANPYKYVHAQGVIVPDTADIRDEVIAEFRGAFGQDMSDDPGTPQGALINMETINRTASAQQCAQLANQINPDMAQGVFLDAICALLGIYRRAATRTLKRGVVLLGSPNTVVRQGVRVSTEEGAVFVSMQQATIRSNGESEPINFQSLDYGPVQAPVGSLRNIGDTVLGWTNVRDDAIPVLGRLQESDAALAQRRRNMLAKQGRSSVEAQVSDLYGVEGVRSLQFRENISANVATIDGITMLPHSVWACVDGGGDIEIATSLLENKTDGAAWNGDVLVDVLEPASGQRYPVRFDRPDPIAFAVRVTVRVRGTTDDPNQRIPQIVEDYANGDIEGFPGFAVGIDVAPFDISASIGAVQPGFMVRLVEVRKVADGNSAPWSTDLVAIGLREIATTGRGNVAVIVVP